MMPYVMRMSMMAATYLLNINILLIEELIEEGVYMLHHLCI
jgi:hypothetical protein